MLSRTLLWASYRLERCAQSIPHPQAPDSHVVAVRITSEDAAAGFKPTAGRIDELHFRPTPEVSAAARVDGGFGWLEPRVTWVKPAQLP